MNCWDRYIGIKGLCDNVNYRIYLDDYGLSLLSMSKVADERFFTGKKLLQSLIDRAWKDTFNDIQFDKFEVNKIILDTKLGAYLDCDTTIQSGVKALNFKTSDNCTLTEFYISTISINVLQGGDASLSITSGGTTTEIFSGTLENNTKYEIPVNDFVGDDFTIILDASNITLCKTYNGANCDCGCTSYTQIGDLNGMTIDLQIRCNKSKYLCKFLDVIAPIVVHKIMGMFWHEVETTNRFSEFVNFKQEVSSAQMIYHDSQYMAMMPTELISTARVGQYQLKLDKLDIPQPKCKCCVSCKGTIQIVTALN